VAKKANRKWPGGREVAEKSVDSPKKDYIRSRVRKSRAKESPELIDEEGLREMFQKQKKWRGQRGY
jgi:hypothetical protein